MKNYCMMAVCLLSLATGLFPTAGSAQVSGQLTTTTGNPIPLANVLLLEGKDSALVKAALTDEKGSYRIGNIRPGKYVLRYSSMGYQTQLSDTFTLTATRMGIDFGVLVMQEHPKELNEVVVRAEKPLIRQQPGGIVVNVESSVLTKGSSALEILERSPGVVLDAYSNDILLNGKGGVSIMLNGRLMHMTLRQMMALLNGISADDIEKIELLTTPPAGYDAEGSGGIINIVLKKNKRQGTNGTFSLSGGYGWREKGTASLNLSHNTGNVNVYGSYTFSHSRSYVGLFITGNQNMPLLGGPLDMMYWDTTLPVQNNQDAMAGFDIRLNSKTTLGGSVTLDLSHLSSTMDTRATYNILPDSLLSFNGQTDARNRWTNLMSSVYLDKQLRKGEKINLDLDYLSFANNNPSYVQSNFVNENGETAGTNDVLVSPVQQGFANTLIRVGVGKMDYSEQLSQQLRLEAGIKGTYTESSSSSGIESLAGGVWTNSIGTSNDIVMKEGIGALYSSLTSQINASTNLVIGARYEYSRTHMDDPATGENTIDRKLGELFPNLFFSTKTGEHSELQLSYSKRISRPSYNDLASFVTYSDPTSVTTGNPFLEPTITNNVKLGYNYRGYFFSFLYSRDDKPIVRYQLTPGSSGGILYVSPQNLVYRNNWTFQTSLPWKVNDWLTMNYSFVGGWKQFKEVYTIDPLEKSYFDYSLNFTGSFKLPRSFGLEVSGWYHSAYYEGTVKTDGFGSLNAGIKKELKNNGGTFQLALSDLLKTIRINKYYGTLTEEAYDIKNHVRVYPETTKSPIIMLTYSRSFGSGTAKNQRKQGAGSEEERERVRKD